MQSCNKRVITNDEFNIAYKNEDNIKIINSFSKKFKNLTFEEITTCGMLAVWKTLQDHDTTKGKFTNSLYRFMYWECLKQLEENKHNVRVWPYSTTNKAVYYCDSDHLESKSNHISGKKKCLTNFRKPIFVY